MPHFQQPWARDAAGERVVPFAFIPGGPIYWTQADFEAAVPEDCRGRFQRPNTPEATPAEAQAPEHDSREAYADVQAWAEATAPVTFARDWWRAIARPVGGSHEANPGHAWNVFAEENRPGFPAFQFSGEFVGRVEGATQPDADTVAAMVAEWESCGE